MLIIIIIIIIIVIYNMLGFLVIVKLTDFMQV